MRTILTTISLLIISNIFMTFAWYGHLKSLRNKPLIIAIAVSWMIALLEYTVQVPANRLGNSVLKVGQLKIIQEIITLSVFIPFSILFLKEKITLNYLIASALMCLSAYFVFKN
ncbi:MAG: DMT family protein [Spirochaetes bacterium]|nr:DMT family protein [Spirochaetota bacterium]